MNDDNTVCVFGGSVANYLYPKEYGVQLLDRLQAHHDWWDTRYESGVDPYSKSSVGPIQAECRAKDRRGSDFEGINMASQDYLALASHPEIKKAAKK